MKTFLVDLHGGLARFGPARPLLYPFLASGRLELLGAADAGALAEAMRISSVRDYRPRVQAVFLVDLPAGPGGRGLAEQLGWLRAEVLAPLAAAGLQPARVVVVALDSLAREPHTGVPLDPAARERWERDAEALAGGDPAALRELHLLRFPLRRAPEPAFQQDLVSLVYLAGALVELFEAGEELGGGRVLGVDEVALDGPAVAAWMAEYERALGRALDAVGHQLEHPEPVTLRLVEDAGCGCAGALDLPRLGQKTFRRL
ncbi:MAG TPA: hypothetical protein VFX98_07750, partial [Longimicrobiaceae bacterium]|nr:hypothetical protein [Longimicrobiaceae bacterium]